MTRIGKSDSLKMMGSQQRGATYYIPGSFLSVGTDFQDSPMRNWNVNINRAKSCPTIGGKLKEFKQVLTIRRNLLYNF